MAARLYVMSISSSNTSARKPSNTSSNKKKLIYGIWIAIRMSFYACDFSHLVIIFVKTCIARAIGNGPVARAGWRRRRLGPPRPRILGAVAGRFT